MAGHRGRLMPIICIFTFFLSSVIDNLTSTIVALKILRSLAAKDQDFRHVCGSLAVIAANAGGVWSAVGDVTTTMLWIQSKVTAPKLVVTLFLPSVVAGVLPLLGIWWQWRRDMQRNGTEPRESRARVNSGNSGVADDDSGQMSKKAQRRVEKQPLSMNGRTAADMSQKVTAKKVLVLVVGILLILMVPTLKILTGLPPYLGMLLALGTFWMLTDSLDLSVEESSGVPGNSPRSTGGHDEAGVMAALHKVDLSGLLFFAGVLLAVGALDSAGVLRRYATNLVQATRGSPVALCTLLGLSSAVVDNVPLVQAAIDMFNEVSTDDPLWHLIALAAGTGGSCLSVGSIAGVTLMSMEGVGFLWYLRRIGPWALVGFFGGILTCQAQRWLGAF